MKMLTKFLVIVAAATLWLSSAQAQFASIGEAIDVAGSQRMLTQRVVKSYCLVVLGVKPDNFSAELSASLDRYNKQLQDLKNYATTDNVKRALDQVDSLWDGFKSLAENAPQRGSVEELRATGEKLLQASHQVVVALQDTSGTEGARIVNVSGRQRMLSQRIANLYMMSAMGINSENISSDLETATKEFKAALKELRAADINTGDIESTLKKVKTQFSLFEFSVKKRSEDHFPFVIADSAEKILKDMHQITGMYAGLVN